MTPPTLQARRLTRTFGGGATRVTVLTDVSLEVHRGEFALLMGPSGSGKSTLLAVLSGLLRPTSGRVLALGDDLCSMSDEQCEEFRRTHCGFIFQGYDLFPALTARQQVEIVLRWGEGAYRRAARKRADEILAALGLTGKGDLRPCQMSVGERQRVAIARALVKNPTLCFADEPTASLDWENGRRVIEILRGAADVRGATILVVAHDPRIIPYADRVFHLESGCIRSADAEGPAPAAPGALVALG